MPPYITLKNHYLLSNAVQLPWKNLNCCDVYVIDSKGNSEHDFSHSYNFGQRPSYVYRYASQLFGVTTLRYADQRSGQ